MFQHGPINQFDPGLPGVLAFRITDRVDRDAMAAMAQVVLDAFESHGKLDMLLSFLTDETATPGASLSVPAMKAQMQSLSHVRHYVTAGAPGWAEGMIEAMGSVLPVEARTFDTEAEALAFLGSHPPPNA